MFHDLEEPFDFVTLGSPVPAALAQAGQDPQRSIHTDNKDCFALLLLKNIMLNLHYTPWIPAGACPEPFGKLRINSTQWSRRRLE
jgi:hypothetical protein